MQRARGARLSMRISNPLNVSFLASILLVWAALAQGESENSSERDAVIAAARGYHMSDIDSVRFEGPSEEPDSSRAGTVAVVRGPPVRVNEQVCKRRAMRLSKGDDGWQVRREEDVAFFLAAYMESSDGVCPSAGYMLVDPIDDGALGLLMRALSRYQLRVTEVTEVICAPRTECVPPLARIAYIAVETDKENRTYYAVHYAGAGWGFDLELDFTQSVSGDELQLLNQISTVP